jgi:hypothetical protein
MGRTWTLWFQKKDAIRVWLVGKPDRIPPGSCLHCVFVRDVALSSTKCHKLSVACLAPLVKRIGETSVPVKIEVAKNPCVLRLLPS